MYVDDGIALEVKNIEELSKGIINVFNPEIAADLSENRKKFIDEYVYGLDGESSKRIMNVIIDLLDKKS